EAAGDARHLQAPRAVAELAAGAGARAIALLGHFNREVCADAAAEARHVDVGVDLRRHAHVDAAADGRKLHVVGRAVEAADFDLDVAADGLGVDRAADVVDADFAAHRRGLDASAHLADLDVAAHRGDVVKVILHRARHLHLEADARLAVAVFRVARADLDAALGCAVLGVEAFAAFP